MVSEHMMRSILMADSDELIQALDPVLRELDRLHVSYYVGGSVASTFHGAARSTLDVDLMAELNESTTLSLLQKLQADYYSSQAAALDAVRRSSCFNLLHFETSFKVDIFVSRGREFDNEVLARAKQDMLGTDLQISARIASVEDVILLKLEWFRLGNDASERQWNDVTEVATLHGPCLDRAYLKKWAEELGVPDLLDRLLIETGI